MTENMIKYIRNEQESNIGRSLISNRQFPWYIDLDFDKTENETISKFQAKWTRNFSKGIDYTHGYATMFDQMNMSFGAETSGITYLDLGKGSLKTFDSSANADCVLSLAAALSAQPE